MVLQIARVRSAPTALHAGEMILPPMVLRRTANEPLDFSQRPGAVSASVVLSICEGATMSPKPAAVCVSLALLAAGCGERVAPPLAISLVDSYKPELVTGSIPPAKLPEKTEWRFDGPE